MKITIKISRFDAKKDKEAHTASYEIEYENGMTVLNGLEKIRKSFDPALAIRWNCGAGKCGSCAVEMDSVPILACKTQIPNNAKEITITPMRVFPVVKDLVVDLTQMRETIKKVPGFAASAKPFFKIYGYDTIAAREMKKCIECGICQDVCHVIREHKKDYSGPRAAVKAASFEMHPQDNQKRAEAMEKLGLGFCNVTKCCQSVCPEGIRITDDAIIPMKEKIAALNRGRFLKRIFGLGGLSGDKK